MAESKKYRPLVIAASVLVPVVVAILFTVRIPDAEPLTFLASNLCWYKCANFTTVDSCFIFYKKWSKKDP